jgi:hypothetical protein
MTLAQWESEVLSFSLDHCCLLDPAPIQSAHKVRKSKVTAQRTTDTTHFNESLLLGSVLIEFTGRLRKITRWIHCSFQLHQIIPAGTCLACSHRRPEEKDGSKGKWGLRVLSDQYWERCSDSVYNFTPCTHRESLRKATAQWGLWCYHFGRFFLTVDFIDFRAIPHTCVKLTLSPPPPPTPVATWAI